MGYQFGQNVDLLYTLVIEIHGFMTRNLSVHLNKIKCTP